MKLFQNKKRICIFDEVRGLAVILMVIYHAFYSMTFLFNFETAYPIMLAIMPYELIIPIMFITICGIVCSFSRNNLKRGIKILIIALIITIVTYIVIPSETILFGILHFLGIALILYVLIEKFTDKINDKVGATVSILLFIVLYNVPHRYIGILPYPSINLPDELYHYYFLSFLGFPSPDFTSGDYFPIIPHIFLFLFGVFIGKIIKEKKLPAWTYRKFCPPLDFIGKHALFIYVVHQPVIIGILWIYRLVI